MIQLIIIYDRGDVKELNKLLREGWEIDGYSEIEDLAEGTSGHPMILKRRVYKLYKK